MNAPAAWRPGESAGAATGGPVSREFVARGNSVTDPAGGHGRLRSSTLTVPRDADVARAFSHSLGRERTLNNPVPVGPDLRHEPLWPDAVWAALTQAACESPLPRAFG